MKNLGEKIKSIRIARNLTQTEIAEKLNVNRSTISHWEANTKTPTFDNIVEYAKIMGVTLDYFSDNSPERTLFQTMAQLDQLFMDASIPAIDKDKAFVKIMEVYRESKLSGIAADLGDVQIYDNKNLPEAKEE